MAQRTDKGSNPSVQHERAEPTRAEKKKKCHVTQRVNKLADTGRTN